MCRFVSALQDWSLCFLQSCGDILIKSQWPSSQFFEFLVPRSPGWEPWCEFKNLTPGRPSLELFLVSLGEMEFDFVWFFPSSYCLTEASLSLGYLFLKWIQHPPVDGCSAASCNFVALTGRKWPHNTFYLTILNQAYFSIFGWLTYLFKMHSMLVCYMHILF